MRGGGEEVRGGERGERRREERSTEPSTYLPDVAASAMPRPLKTM